MSGPPSFFWILRIRKLCLAWLVCAGILVAVRGDSLGSSCLRVTFLFVARL